METPNSPASAPSLWDRPASLEYHLLPAKDLKLIKPKDHAELSQASDGIETHAHSAASKAERSLLTAYS